MAEMGDGSVGLAHDRVAKVIRIQIANLLRKKYLKRP